MKVVIIIPARYGSSRLRGKPLYKILGREMVLRVADICSKVVGKENLYIATDSKKISNVAQDAKYKTIKIYWGKHQLNKYITLETLNKFIDTNFKKGITISEPIFNCPVLWSELPNIL